MTKQQLDNAMLQRHTDGGHKYYQNWIVQEKSMDIEILKKTFFFHFLNSTVSKKLLDTAKILRSKYVTFTA